MRYSGLVAEARRKSHYDGASQQKVRLPLRSRAARQALRQLCFLAVAEDQFAAGDIDCQRVANQRPQIIQDIFP